MTFAQRGALLKEMSKVLRDHRDELLDLSRRNNGTTPSGRLLRRRRRDRHPGLLRRPVEVAWATGTFLPEGDGVQLAKTEGFWAQHILVPRRGVAVHINAFNFPAWGFAEKAACALLAGMPVITKPATATALTTERCIELIVEAGILPEGALQLIIGSTGDLLDRLGPQDVLAFTGSADTARKLRSAAEPPGRQHPRQRRGRQPERRGPRPGRRPRGRLRHLRPVPEGRGARDHPEGRPEVHGRAPHPGPGGPDRRGAGRADLPARRGRDRQPGGRRR